ncbi:Predicted PurR-regulated permease PerM [Verrucomicrobium sp. GAS474]|uniref:AI-2E family transporter n=1 Tax=Verrucomicrobium sp. GAS474 TaxID=1882831 RepID=UPI00087D6BE1|nr:AI-2E family transporter [Verrucomicrobium sp. GAS474]SDU28374.1 Predicted PurR-regulated permease PerM [Verrucomicrobium sp. GAS474]
MASPHFRHLTGPGIRQPLVWLGVIGATFLILLLFKAVLWLSVPLTLALVSYYLCAPLAERLKRLGLSHGQAVTAVVVGLLAATGLVVTSLLPGFGTFSDRFDFYVSKADGLSFSALRLLEDHYPWMARLHAADLAGGTIHGWAGQLIHRDVARVLGSLAVWIFPLLLVPYMTFFFLRDGSSFKKLLMRGVPNAFFERVMLLFHRMDHQIHQYFRGMAALTALDTLTLGFGLWLIGHHHPLFHPWNCLFLGLACAVLAWLPYLGSLLGCFLILLVCVAEAPGDPTLLVSAGGLFLIVRLVDDFIYSPLTVGKSLNIHPLLTVGMIFVGGAIAGIAGMVLVLPVLGICTVIGEVFELVWFDERLRARHAHAAALRKTAARESLQSR